MVDLYNFNKSYLASNPNMVATRNRGASSSDGKRRFEFAYVPNMDFLADAYPLNKSVELKLSFDRAPYQCALIEIDTPAVPQTGSISIEDCHALVDFVSSPYYRNYFSSIDTMPTTYSYEATDVIVR